ncbi:hypothetical protein JTE90_014411 [Oedothorax gibbosus]|uniref:Uncharacterized protein n=1 Tax=Oedothorax gibbosus TaxID=931172 RepID=A0AAV6UFI0_9ARAC|nr:hypothetical protein JTE90_014411 [Oedothorax gibbosus]
MPIDTLSTGTYPLLKRRFLRLARKRVSQEAWIHYKKCASKLRKIIKAAKKKFWEKICEEGANSGSIYRIIKVYRIDRGLTALLTISWKLTVSPCLTPLCKQIALRIYTGQKKSREASPSLWQGKRVRGIIGHFLSQSFRSPSNPSGYLPRVTTVLAQNSSKC